MRIKSKIALFTATALAVAALAGCRGGGPAPVPENGDAPTGRYIEETWDLPFDAVNLTGLHQRPDGRIAMLFNDMSGIQRYFSTTDGTDWQEESPAWLEALGDEAEFVSEIRYNSAGQGVIQYYPPSLIPGYYQTRIALLDADGSLTLTPIGEEGSPWSNDFLLDYYTELAAEAGIDADEVVVPFQIMDLCFTEDGRLIVQSGPGESGRLDPATGEVEVEYLTGGYALALAGGQVAQILPQNAAEAFNENMEQTETFALYFLDPDTGEQIRKLDATPAFSQGGGLALATDAGGSLYLAGSDGLFRLAAGGETWEQVLDGRLSSLSIPNTHVRTLIPHGDNEFLMEISGETLQLVNLVYDPAVSSVPDSELVVYEMTHNPALLQAAGAFRKTNPNVMVTVRSASDPDFVGSGDEFIKVVNTELLAGKGPDLFLLDNMPIDSYIEKGVLADLSAVLDPLLQEGALLENVAASMRGEDGGLYAVPTRFYIPTLWGSAEALDAAKNLTSLADYAESSGKRLFADLSPSTLLFNFGRGVQSQILTGDYQVNVDLVEQLLTDVKRITDTAEGVYILDGAEDSDAYPYMEDTRWQSIYEPDTGNMFDHVTGNCELMFGNLGGFQDAMFPNAAVYKARGGAAPQSEDPGITTVPDSEVNTAFRLLPAGDRQVFYPHGVIGVNQNSSQQELALEFAKTMLGEAAQSVDMGYAGFPVNREALQNIRDRELTTFHSTSFYADDGERIAVDATWPSKAMLQAISDQLELVDTPVLDQYELMGVMIVEAAQPFFEDEITAREAAEKLAKENWIQLKSWE